MKFLGSLTSELRSHFPIWGNSHRKVAFSRMNSIYVVNIESNCRWFLFIIIDTTYYYDTRNGMHICVHVCNLFNWHVW